MKKGVATVVSTVFGTIAGAGVVYRAESKKLDKWKELNYKNDAILKVFTQWFKMKQKGKSLTDYFVENNYKSIAVYGMHYLGECLVQELKGTDIEIKYIIDQNADHISLDTDEDGESYTIIKPEEKFSKVDAIVVTAFYFFDQIEETLSDKVDCPILSLEDIIYEME